MTWVPGKSGNPKGRPKAEHDVAAMCRALTPEIVRALALALDEPGERTKAAGILLDRGYGKAPLVIEGADTGSLTMLHLIAARQVAEQMQALLAAGVKPDSFNGNGHGNGKSNGHSNGNGHTIDCVAIDYTKPALE